MCVAHRALCGDRTETESLNRIFPMYGNDAENPIYKALPYFVVTSS